MAQKTVAYGKLVLFGEYSALYNYPVLGISLPLYTEVVIKKRLHFQRNKKRVSNSSLFLSKVLIQKISSDVDINDFFANNNIKINSNIIQGIGYGSSAALCTALAKAFLKHKDINEIWKKANEAEKYFHGKALGIDTGLALSKGIKAFKPCENNLPEFEILQTADLYILCGAIPGMNTSKELQQKISKQIWKPEVKQIIEDLGMISENSINLLKEKKDNYKKYLGDNAVIAHDKLRRLGLSSVILEEIIELGMMNGALGGKMSGGGSGGAYFFIFDNKSSAENVYRKLIAYYLENKINIEYINNYFKI